MPFVEMEKIMIQRTSSLFQQPPFSIEMRFRGDLSAITLNSWRSFAVILVPEDNVKQQIQKWRSFFFFSRHSHLFFFFFLSWNELAGRVTGLPKYSNDYHVTVAYQTAVIPEHLKPEVKRVKQEIIQLFRDVDVLKLDAPGLFFF